MRETQDQYNQMFTLSSNVLARLGRILTYLVGIAGLAYVVGWLSATAYFEAFKAAWLVDVLSASQILRFSWYPLTLLVMGVMAVLFYMQGEEVHFIWPIGIGAVIGAVVTIALLGSPHSWFSWPSITERISTGLPTILSWVIGVLFAVVVSKYASSRSANKRSAPFFAFLLFLLSIYVLPSVAGSREANRDRNVKDTHLPLVEITNGQKYRLLVVSNEHYYLVDLGAKLSIRVVSSQDIKEITGQR